VRLVALLHELTQQGRLGDPRELLRHKFTAPVIEAIAAFGDRDPGALLPSDGEWPFAARVVALADRYDEFVSGERDGSALSPRQAVQRIRDEANGFDEKLLAQLEELAPKRGLLHTDTVITPAPRI